MKSMGIRIDETVVQEAGCRFAEDAAAVFTPLDSFESGVFAWLHSGKRYILKLTDRQRRTETELLAEIDFLHFASDQGVRVARAIVSRSGRYIEPVYDQSDEESCKGYWAYAFEWAAGEELRPQDWGAELFHQWGSTVGKLHRVTSKYKPSNPEWMRSRWDEEELYKQRVSTAAAEPLLLTAGNSCLERLRQVPERPDQFGLIHNDLHPGNFHLFEGKLVVFDFDGLVYHHFASDIAIALYYAIGWDKSSNNKTLFAETFLNHFLEGYACCQPVTQELLHAIPDWMMLRHLLLYTAHQQKWSESNLNTMQRWTLNRYRKDLSEGKLFGGIDIRQIMMKRGMA
jgi:Ser/Thr protein kinase RdoA (MazF antagonist)